MRAVLRSGIGLVADETAPVRADHSRFRENMEQVQIRHAEPLRQQAHCTCVFHDFRVEIRIRRQVESVAFDHLRRKDGKRRDQQKIRLRLPDCRDHRIQIFRELLQRHKRPRIDCVVGAAENCHAARFVRKHILSHAPEHCARIIAGISGVNDLVFHFLKP